MFLLIKHGLSRLSRHRLGSSVALVATELVIIFVGVYAADFVADRRERREQEMRQHVVVGALEREIAPFVAEADAVMRSIRQSYAAWQQAYTAGRRPPPFFVPATASLSRPHAALWTAMLDSGGLDLLPIEALAEISDFYARTDRMLERYRRLDDFAQRQILPYLELEQGSFYAPGQTKLKPIYANYIEEAEAAIRYAEETVALGSRLEAELDSGRLLP